jgi:C4-dicarboxylate transporter DctM subunit
MTRGSIASRLIDVARAALGWLPGGLGIGAVIACAMFAAISGSSPVTVIAIGGVMLPMLIKEGYPEGYALGVLTTSGGLGIIIPPSIPMIVYAIMVSGTPGVGIIDPAVLFRAGIGPGAFIALVLSGYTLFRFWPREQPGADPAAAFETPPHLREGMIALAWAVFRGLPSLFLPVLILGGIYGWLNLGGFTVRFTVTEAAAVAVLYALAVELVLHRELRLRDVPGVFSTSAMQLGSLFLLIVISISLNRFFVFEEVPERAAAWMLDWVHSPLQFLLAANLFLLALGCVMDVLSAILIVAPLLAPVAAQYGIHPVHFAIIFIVNLEIGYLTPPMGINLFVASTVFQRPLLQVARAVVPFLLLMLGCLAVIALFPSLSLFLAGL